MDKLLLTDEIKEPYVSRVFEILTRRGKTTVKPTEKVAIESQALGPETAGPRSISFLRRMLLRQGRANRALSRVRGKSNNLAFALLEPSILVYGRRKFALALSWAPLQEGSSIQELAQSQSIAGESPDLWVAFKKKRQVGLAVSSKDLRQGVIAAATCFRLSDLGQNWFALFRLATEQINKASPWWLIVYRDGLVYEDRLYFDEEVAKSEVRGLLNVAGWENVLVPSGWDYPHTTQKELQEVFWPRAGTALRSTKWIKANASLILFGMLLVASAVAGWLYWENIKEQERLLEEERLRQLSEQRLEELQIPPWVGTPVLEEFVRQCTAEVERNFLVLSGWTPQPVNCTQDGGRVTFSAEWQRSGGLAAWIIAAARQNDISVDLSDDLDTARLITTLEVKERASAPETPLEGQTIDRLLSLRFDTLSLSPEFNEVLSRAIPEQAQEEGAPIWNYHELEFITPSLLDEYIDLIADIPSVVPISLVYSVVAHEWRLKVRIYHPPL